MDTKGSITVAGPVLDINQRSGVSPTTGNAWSFTIVTVLVGKTTQEVRWDSDTQGGLPKEGDTIAVEVQLSTYKGLVQAMALRYAPEGTRKLAPTG